MVSVDTFPGDFEDVGIPRIIEGAKEISRAHRVDYLGDTHGNYEGFLYNMKKLWLIDARGDWIGGDRRLIMLGDIYGDRNLGSIPTALHLEKLISQGAHIEMIYWNHDDMVVSYFDHAHNPNELIRQYLIWHWLKGSRVLNSIRGMQELAEFKKGSMPKDWLSIIREPDPESILGCMRKLKRWVKVLTNICRFQIGRVIDDTLFIHTDPVDSMITIFDKYDWDMEKINALFRGFLVHTLINGEKPDWATLEEVMLIRQLFISANNRRTWERNIPQLSQHIAHEIKGRLNIHRIIHGHSNHWQAQTMVIWGLEITSADNSSFKKGNYAPWNTYISAGSILTNGHRIAPKA
jgi:hypothetical protein